jgi:hypothetical protein
MSTFKCRISPLGLAFKPSEKAVSDLLDEGQAEPLKYFAKGKI